MVPWLIFSFQENPYNLIFKGLVMCQTEQMQLCTLLIFPCMLSHSCVGFLLVRHFPTAKNVYT